jgi:hypothetical protein
MPTWGWIVIGVVAVAVIALVAVAVLSRQRTSRLRRRFGPEYDRTVERRGGRREAESDLGSRVERREQLEIRELPSEARRRYLDSWRQVQAEFVDDPGAAVTNADRLVTSVMSDRGYPMDDFERRASDISVDYPQVVERYRSAHGIARKKHEGQATTEDLRQAMQHYRALFEELLEPAEDQPLQREQADEAEAPSGRKEGVTER